MKEDKKIQFILPGFLNVGIFEKIINIYEKYLEITNEDSTIYSIFGSFPCAIWNGGRPDIGEPEYDIKQMKKVRDYYNSKGIAIAFTFTNPLIKEEHLEDKYCNNILKVFNNGKNEVLVNSKILEKYIRENYPNYKINQSITTTDKRDYSLNGYHLAVLKKDLNHNFEYLKKIPLKDRERIELLCNEMCINNCKYTFQHYEEMSNVQLRKRNLYDVGLYGVCKHRDKINRNAPFKWLKDNSKYYIDPKDIYEKYVPLGFKYFKIQGRERFSTVGMNSIIFYCIKPKYQRDVRTYLSERMLNEYKEYKYGMYQKLDDAIKELDMQGWKYI